MVVSGRLLILYRREDFNVRRKNLEMLNEAVQHYLSQIDQDLSPHEAWIGTTIVSTTYVRLNQFGYRFMVSFWAWGDSEDEAFDNLERLFRALRECLTRVSEDLKAATDGVR